MSKYFDKCRFCQMEIEFQIIVHSFSSQILIEENVTSTIYSWFHISIQFEMIPYCSLYLIGRIDKPRFVDLSFPVHYIPLFWDCE